MAFSEKVQPPLEERREAPKSFNIAVLVSPTSLASNLRAILAAQSQEDFYGRVSLVIADQESAPGLQIAKDNDIEAIALPYKRPEGMNNRDYRAVYSAQIGQLLTVLDADIAVLAGFNRILTEPYFENFCRKTINIHPGAIPDKRDEPYRFEDGTIAPWNQGMMADSAVTNFLTLPFATSTIHIATLEADFGPVLKRVFTKVEPGDDVDSLYARLKVEEHKGLIEVLKNPPL